jgi:PAS domain S-box-containing protein
MDTPLPNNYLENFFDIVPEPLCFVTPQGEVVEANAAFCRFIGMDKTNCKKDGFAQKIHPKYQPIFRSVLTLPSVENVLLLCKMPDDTFKPLYWQHFYLPNSPYYLVKLCAFFVLNVPQQSFFHAVTLEEGWWDWCMDNNIIYYNDTWKKIIGHNPEKLYNDLSVWQNYMHHQDLKQTYQLIEACKEGKIESFEIEQRFYNENNETVYVNCKAYMIRHTTLKSMRMIGIIKDITPLKSTKDELHKKDLLLDQTQEIAKMGSWEWDVQSDKVLWSAQLYRLLGFEPNSFQPVADSLLRFVHPKDLQKVFADVQTCIQSNQLIPIECRVITHDKREVFVRCEAKAEFADFNQFAKVIAVVRDITDQKNNENALVIAKENAENSAKIKENFISTMSHELRTPMNAVLGMTNLLLQESPQQHQQKYLEVLQSAAKNLLLLINDILDISKIEAGKVSFEHIDFNIEELVQNITNIYQYTAQEKGLKLDLLYDKAIYPLLIGDPTKLTQILTNLISNAIKFTNQGVVSIQLQLLNTQQDSVTIQFLVKDTGIGIAKSKLHTIFDSFTQATTDTSRKYGGTGLGLTISKNYIELQGGKLEVQSEEGQGSTFFFTLTLPKSKLTAWESQKPIETAQQFVMQHIKILIAEDNETNQFVVSRFLDSWKIQYDFANDGREVIHKIQSQEYDMVLMDIQMPEVDGYQAAKIIRQMEGEYYQNIPIIALTASVLSSVGAKVKAAGMNDFVMKPFEPTELLAKITQYAKQNILIKGNTAVSAEKVFDAKQFEYPIDFTQFSTITMNDTAFSQELLRLYIKQFKEYTQEIQLLVKNRATTAISVLHHKIKSSIVILRLYELQELQKALEEAVQQQQIKVEQEKLKQIMVICAKVEKTLENKIGYEASSIKS